MPGQVFPFNVNLGDGVTAKGPIGFIPKSVGVDNPTPVYIHFPDYGFGGYIRPFTLGAVIPATTAGRSINVTATDVPPPGVYGAPVTNAGTPTVANCIAFEDAQAYSPGYSVGPSGIQNAFAQTPYTIGTYNQILPTQSFAKGGLFFVYLPAGTGTVTVQISNLDSQGNGSAVLTSAALAGGSGLALLRVYPGIAVSANSTASDVLGPSINIRVTVATNTQTFRIDYYLIP